MEYKIPACQKKFVAREHFVVGSRLGTGFSVKILSLDENFEKWFLGKEEPSFGGSTVTDFVAASDRVSEQLSDVVVARKLGGKHTITLYEVFSLMQMQDNFKNGQEYPLVMCGGWGWANRFFVMDQAGIVRMVQIYHESSKVSEHVGWKISALPFNHRKTYKDWIFYRVSNWQRLRQSVWSRVATILEETAKKTREKILQNH